MPESHSLLRGQDRRDSKLRSLLLQALGDVQTISGLLQPAKLATPASGKESSPVSCTPLSAICPNPTAGALTTPLTAPGSSTTYETESRHIFSNRLFETLPQSNENTPDFVRTKGALPNLQSHKAPKAAAAGEENMDPTWWEGATPNHWTGATPDWRISANVLLQESPYEDEDTDAPARIFTSVPLKSMETAMASSGTPSPALSRRSSSSFCTATSKLPSIPMHFMPTHAGPALARASSVTPTSKLHPPTHAHADAATPSPMPSSFATPTSNPSDPALVTPRSAQSLGTEDLGFSPTFILQAPFAAPAPSTCPPGRGGGLSPFEATSKAADPAFSFGQKWDVQKQKQKQGQATGSPRYWTRAGPDNHAEASSQPESNQPANEPTPTTPLSSRGVCEQHLPTPSTTNSQPKAGHVPMVIARLNAANLLMVDAMHPTPTTPASHNRPASWSHVDGMRVSRGALWRTGSHDGCSENGDTPKSFDFTPHACAGLQWWQ
eukprot:gene91-3698_t